MAQLQSLFIPLELPEQAVCRDFLVHLVACLLLASLAVRRAHFKCGPGRRPVTAGSEGWVAVAHAQAHRILGFLIRRLQLSLFITLLLLALANGLIEQVFSC